MKTALALLISVIVLGAASNDAGVLTGRIVDPSGAVVPGAVVKLTNRAGGASLEMTAGRDGRFRAVAVPPGIYEIVAESAGFAPYHRGDMQVVAGETANLDIALRLSAMNEQVAATAKAPAGEEATETSSRNSHETLEIREARESSAKDVGEAISNLEGLWKVRKGGIANDVVLRGFQQGNVDVLIDGNRIYGACPSHMDPAASHVDFSEIASVEVTKGPFDIRNQGSLGGTVNIVGKRPGYGLQFTPNVGAGSFGFVNPSLTSSYENGKFYALAGYSFRRSDPFVDGLGRSVTSYANYTPAGAANPAFQVNTGWARFGAQLTPNQNVEVSFTRQDGGLTLYPGLTMDAAYDRANRLSANWTLADLHGFVKQVRAEGYYSTVKHWMSDSLRVSATGPLGFNMGTFAGTKALGGRIEADLPDAIVGVEAYDRGWSVVANMFSMGKYSAQAALPDVRMLVGGLYGQYKRSFGRLTVSLGGRADVGNSAARNGRLDTNLYWMYHGTRSTSNVDAAPSGNIRLTYLMPRGVELFAGFGSSVRLPDPEERYYAVKRMGTDFVGNPTLEPTRNNETDIGINVRGGRFTLRPTLFYSRLSNYVGVVQQMKMNSIAGYMNPSARSYQGVDARLYGGEVSYSVGFTRTLLLSGGVSYTRGIEFAKPSAGLPKVDMSEMPPLKARSSLRYGNPLFFAEVNGLASAAQKRVDSLLQEQPTAGYGLLGFKAGIHHKRMNLSVGVDNALDRLYFESLSYQRDPYRSGVRIPEPGRTLFVNLSLGLGER